MKPDATDLTQLALSIHANKGVYALLLGSGVSRSAGIPSGWEVMARLIQQLALMEGKSLELDSAEAWYADRFGEPAGYSAVMARLFRTSSERLGAMRGFFEPTEEERSGDPTAKRPTQAHRAIARMIRDGYFRVVVTTNFDRLLEQALEAEGIQPTEIASAGAAKGAVPLVHSPCTIIKVNGDYLDIRQLHTSDELTRYPQPITKLLNRVFDEYGLITCGWSGEYDHALSDAIRSSPSRRYPMTFCQFAEPHEEARALVRDRDGRFLPITGADAFFEELEGHLDMLESQRDTRSLDSTTAVSLLRRYAFGDENLDRYRSLLDRVVSDIEPVLREPEIYPNRRNPAYDDRGALDRVDATIQPLVAMALWGGYWADAKRVDLWAEYMARILEAQSPDLRSVPGLWPRYTATMAYMAFGIGLLHAGSMDRFKHFQFKTIRLTGEYDRRLFDYLPLDHRHDFNRIAPLAHHVPSPGNAAVHWIYRNLNEISRPLIGNERIFRDRFVEMEVLSALLRFVWTGEKSQREPNRVLGLYLESDEPAQAILTRIQSRYADRTNEATFQNSLFGGTIGIREFIDRISELQNVCMQHWRFAEDVRLTGRAPSGPR